MSLYDAMVRLWESRIISDKSVFTGSGSDQFAVDQGSRAIFTFSVPSIDPGTTLTINILNRFGQAENPITLDTIVINAAGISQRVYSDFNQLFEISYVVTGGNATFKVNVMVNDNASTTRIENADLSVDISGYPNTEGRYSSVRVTDGNHEEKINSDGSTNVVSVDGPYKMALVNAATADPVAAGVTTVIGSYTVPTGKQAWLQLVDCGGENIAEYEVLMNDERIGFKRTWFGGGLNTHFDYRASPQRGLPLTAGDIVSVKVDHSRPAAGIFETRIQVIELTI